MTEIKLPDFLTKKYEVSRGLTVLDQLSKSGNFTLLNLTKEPLNESKTEEPTNSESHLPPGIIKLTDLLSQIGNSSDKPPNGTLRQWEKDLKAHFNKTYCDCTQYTRILSVLTKRVGKRIKQNFIEEWLIVTEKLIDTFDTKSLVWAIYSLGRLEVFPPDSWIQKWIVTSENQLNRCGPDNLTKIIQGLASLNITPSIEWWEKYFHEANSKLSHFPQDKLCDLIYAAATLLLPFKYIEKLCRYLKISEYRDFMINQIAVTYPELKLALTKPVCGSVTISGIQLEVYQILTQKYSTVKPEILLPDLQIVVDLYFPDKKAVIEIDGPQHFLSNNNYNGTSIWRTKILERYGYKVLRVKYDQEISISIKKIDEFIQSS